MTYKLGIKPPWCLIYMVGAVLFLAEAKEQDFGFMSPHGSFIQHFWKSIVCNYNEECHYLVPGRTENTKRTQKGDHWRRILRSSGFNNDLAKLTSRVDSSLTRPNQSGEMLKRRTQKLS